MSIPAVVHKMVNDFRQFLFKQCKSDPKIFLVVLRSTPSTVLITVQGTPAN